MATAMTNEDTGISLTAGGALLCCLHRLGIEHVFVNSGTDFPPVIEGLLEAREQNLNLPKLLTIPHEHAALGMAHGHYLISGKPQAVMLHTNVGLANGSAGAINAACEHIPILIMSGRTPISEGGRFGARTVPIGWGQEMRDQAALVREACKWDYELRYPEQVAGLVDRATAIACSTPKGPVYLALPREVLCERTKIEFPDPAANTSIMPSRGAANPEDVAKLAEWIAGARNPLIIAQRGAGDDASFRKFADLVEDWSIPVSTWWATSLAIASDHPCHVGADPGPWLENADLVIILNSLAPWCPDMHRPNPEARIVNIGPDPIFSRFPVRNFRSNLSIIGELSQVIPALADELGSPDGKRPELRRRLAAVSARAVSCRSADVERAILMPDGGISRDWVSLCLGKALEHMESSVFSELGVRLGLLLRRSRNSWFQEPHSGGLGWSFPAALGAQLADPARVCVATMGDGSYMFSNPVVCHQIAESLRLPVLTIVLNNGEWGAVRESVVGLYPGGRASKANSVPLTSLRPSPDYVMVAKASRTWARRVEVAEQLEPALHAALQVVTDERRPAMVEVLTVPD